MSVFLGIDIGTSGTKTLAMRKDGNIRSQVPSRVGQNRNRLTGGKRPSKAFGAS